jgi:HD-like signal output (HDOD) protein
MTTRKRLTAKELVQDISSLLSLPDIYYQVEQMIKDPRFTAVDIGRVIAKDPALATRLLKLVNSSFYGFQARIDTISRAMTIVGVQDLQNLVLATSVVDAFGGISSDLVDISDFWLQSINCGVIAKLLAKESAVLHGERLFLAGLLHKIGSLVLYQELPELSGKVLKLSDYDGALIPVVEQEIIGFTFADVGSELIKAWQLPDSLYEAIACQLSPDQALKYRVEAQLLYIATLFCSSLVYDEQDIIDLWQEIPLEYRSVVKIEGQALVALLMQAQEDVAQVFELLKPGKKFY